MKGYVVRWLVCWVCLCSTAMAQTVVQWNLTTNGNVSSLDTRLVAESVSLVNMALSSASTPASFSTTYGMAVAPSADGKNWNASFDETRYVQFTVGVQSGHLFQISGMSFDVGSYGGNSISVAVYYSLNEDFSNAQALVPTSNPINQSIILNKNTMYPVSYTLSPSLTVLAGQKLYIRFYSMYNTTSSRWLLLRNFALQGSVSLAPPMIFPSVSELEGFVQSGEEPSGVQSYTVRARFLQDHVTIVPPAGFDISCDGSTWVSSPEALVLPRSGDTLLNEPVQIYVRLRTSIPGVNSGVLQHMSSGATPVHVSVTGVKTAFYYSNSTGNLTDLSTWDLNPSGIGSNPPRNFTDDGQTFIIANRTEATISQDWVVSGSGSKVVVGNGSDPVTFIIPPTAKVEATLDVAAYSTLILQNSTLPTFGSFDKNSTVVFDGIDQVTIPPRVYGTLVSRNDGGRARVLAQGTYTIRKAFQPGNANYTIVGSTFNFVDEATGIPSFTYNNLHIGAPGAQVVGTVRVLGQCTLTETVTVPVGSTLILQQGATVTSGKNLIVNGTCVNYDGLTANVLVVNNGGVYEHAVNGGSIPTAQWNDGSTCKITGIIGSPGSDFTGLGGVNQVFSNFVIDCKSLLGKLLLTYNGGSFTVQRTLQIDATGSGIVQIARSTTQNTVNVGRYVQNGGVVYIIHAVSSTGTRTLNVNGDFLLNNNAVFGIINGRLSVASSVTGILTVGGTLEMNGTSRLLRDTARAQVIFNGTTKQRIALQNVSDSISIHVNNPQGIQLAKDFTLRGILVLVNGRVFLGSSTLTVDSIAGATPASYIQVDSTGSLCRYVTNTSVLFPIGTKSGYSPMTIANSGTPDWFSVRVYDDSAGSNNAAERVRLKWSIAEAIIGGSVCTLTLGWMSSMEGEVFALNRSAYSKIWNTSTGNEAGNGTYSTQAVTEPYTVTTYNVTSLGEFVVGKDLNSITTVQHHEQLVPSVLTLSQNYPNPFNPTTTIEFTVTEVSNVKIILYDLLGREIMRIVDGLYNPGVRYRVSIDGKRLASGTYIYRLEARSLASHEVKVLLRKMTVLK